MKYLASSDHRIMPCSTCGQAIIFLPTDRGIRMPINAATVLPEDTQYIPGQHQSHFATCAQASQHRRPK